MFDEEYFYSSAPSDISSDITINIADNNDDDIEQDRDERHSATGGGRFMFLDSGQSRSSNSLSDKITRKLFKKKRREMLHGNLNR